MKRKPLLCCDHRQLEVGEQVCSRQYHWMRSVFCLQILKKGLAAGTRYMEDIPHPQNKSVSDHYSGFSGPLENSPDNLQTLNIRQFILLKIHPLSGEGQSILLAGYNLNGAKLIFCYQCLLLGEESK